MRWKLAIGVVIGIAVGGVAAATVTLLLTTADTAKIAPAQAPAEPGPPSGPRTIGDYGKHAASFTRWFVRDLGGDGLDRLVIRPGTDLTVTVACRQGGPAVVLTLRDGIFFNGDVSVGWGGPGGPVGDRVEYEFTDENRALAGTWQPWVKDVVARLQAPQAPHDVAWITVTKFPDERIIEIADLEGARDALSHLPCL